MGGSLKMLCRTICFVCIACAILYVIPFLFPHWYLSLYDATIQFYLTRIQPWLYTDHARKELEGFLKTHHAISIDSTSFDHPRLINAQRARKNEYVIVALDEAFRHGIPQRIVAGADRAGNVSRLLQHLLPHVRVDGVPVEPHRCIIVDLLTSTGGYFPSMHTDVEWSVFDDSDGFQIWMLLKNDLETGNMFILDTPYAMPASRFQSLGYGRPGVSIVSQCSSRVLAQHKEMRGELKYLGMRPGECLIFGKNLYHCSDPRQSSQREAMNFRVVIADPDGGVPVNLSGMCAYAFRMRMRILGIPMENGRIFPSPMQLLQL